MILAWIDRELMGNTVGAYLTALILSSALVAFVKLYAILIAARLRKLAAATDNIIDDFLIETLDRIAVPIGAALALKVFITLLTVPAAVTTLVGYLLIIVVTYYAVTSALRFVECLSDSLFSARDGQPVNVQAKANIRLFAKAAVWIAGAMLLLKNLGYDVSSVLAGVGIAGVAIALALQNILGDLFSYISLLVDKPFEVGDFIIVGADMGTVEYIGLRTTRLRTLQGQELVISNGDLTSGRINNYKKMEKRRVIFNLGVVYGTPLDKIKAIPGWIEKIVNGIEGLTFDRSHFKGYADSYLDIETVYYVLSSEYNRFMDRQQELNLTIYEKFEQEGVEFAFPTRTIFVKNE